MKEKLWFKRKRFGWGWRPASKEGWVVTIGFLAIVLGIALTLNPEASDKEALFSLLIPIAILTAAFFRILITHGEKPKWQWGKSEKEENNHVDNF